MNKTTTRLFSDAGLNQYQDTDPTASSIFPYNEGAQDILLSPTAKLLNPQPSIDTRLQEALKPFISDRSVLKPDKYRTILEDTRLALLDQIHYEKTQEAKEALNGLKAVLDENAALRTILDQYMNHIKKA